jgi:hypothetical protein
VHDNVVSGSGIADLALIAPAAAGNCFDANTAGTALPPLLQEGYACGSVLSALGGGDVALALSGLGRLIRATALGSYPHGQPRDAPSAPSQPSMPDVNAAPSPAGPAARVDPNAEVRRAAALHGLPPASPVSTDRPLLNIVYLVLGYALPLAAIVAVLWALMARVRSARGLRKRLILAPLAVYLLFLIGVTALEVVRP